MGNLDAGKPWGRGRRFPARRAQAKHLKMMSVNGEVSVAGELANDVVKWAAGEGNDGATFRTDKMMPVAWFADNI